MMDALLTALLPLLLFLVLLMIWRDVAAEEARQQSMDWDHERIMEDHQRTVTERTLRLLRDEHSP